MRNLETQKQQLVVRGLPSGTQRSGSERDAHYHQIFERIYLKRTGLVKHTRPVYYVSWGGK